MQSTLVCVLAVAFWRSINLHISVGVYVPVGGKKLLTFMDDFNMPAKDTFGSQPPLELIRHWMNYGFWYDRAKQIVKQIKVRMCTNSVLKNNCLKIYMYACMYYTMYMYMCMFALYTLL